AALRERLAAGSALVVDLDTSRRYAQGHIPGAWFAIRSRLAEALAKLPTAETLVLTSPDGALARLAAAEIAGAARVPVMVLSGGTEAWTRAGLPAAPRNDQLDINEVILDVVALTRSELSSSGTLLHTQLADRLALVVGD